jgi:hypothetical protein
MKGTMRIVDGWGPNVSWIKKRPAAAGLFFGSGDGRSAATMFTVSVSYFRSHNDGKVDGGD